MNTYTLVQGGRELIAAIWTFHKTLPQQIDGDLFNDSGKSRFYRCTTGLWGQLIPTPTPSIGRFCPGLDELECHAVGFTDRKVLVAVLITHRH